MEGLWVMKDGVDAYFFINVKSDCNGFTGPQIDSVTLYVYN